MTCSAAGGTLTVALGQRTLLQKRDAGSSRSPGRPAVGCAAGRGMDHAYQQCRRMTRAGRMRLRCRKALLRTVGEQQGAVSLSGSRLTRLDEPSVSRTCAVPPQSAHRFCTCGPAARSEGLMAFQVGIVRWGLLSPALLPSPFVATSREGRCLPVDAQYPARPNSVVPVASRSCWPAGPAMSA